MKAIAQDRYGSADVLEFRDIDKPRIDDDGVLVRVRAASVNALDWHVMRGSPYIARPMIGWRRPPTIRGVDVAGEVEAVGRNVHQFRPGDAVFGWCQGAFAEYASAGADHFVAKPASLTFEEAAAIPLAGTTALQGLRAGNLTAGERVLIIGASGGVGTYAVQIAKAWGAEVTGVCSTRNLDLVRSIGADHVIDYNREDFIAGGPRYDLILELAGTRSPLAIRRALTPGGRLVMSSGAGGRWLGPIGRMVKARLSSPFVRQPMAFLTATENHADLVVLHGLIESGAVRPIIDRRYELRAAPDAVRYVDAGHTRGKTVVTV